MVFHPELPVNGVLVVMPWLLQPEDSFDGKIQIEVVAVSHEEPGGKGRGLQGGPGF